jgi:hypothetical protein
MMELIQYKYFGETLKHTSTKKNLCVYRNIFIQPPPVVAGRVNRDQGARPWLVVANLEHDCHVDLMFQVHFGFCLLRGESQGAKTRS